VGALPAHPDGEIANPDFLFSNWKMM